MTTAAANRVVIHLGAETEQAEKGMDRMKEKMKATGKDAGGLSGMFGGLNKRIFAISLASIAGSFGLGALSQAASRVASTAAATTVIVGELGPAFQKNLIDLKPKFLDTGKTFAFTASEVEKAFGIMSRESRNAGLDLEDLNVAMGLSRTFGIDLAAAADIVGKAMLGNVQPLRNLTGELGSYEEIQKTLIAQGEKATTSIQKMGLAFKNFAETLGKIVNVGLGGFIIASQAAGDAVKFLGATTVSFFQSTGGLVASLSLALADLLGAFSGLNAAVTKFILSLPSKVAIAFDFVIGQVGGFIGAFFDNAGKSIIRALHAKVDIGLGDITKLLGNLFNVVTGVPVAQTIKAVVDLGLGTITKLLGGLFSKTTGNPISQTIKAKIDLGLGEITKLLGNLFDVLTGNPSDQTIKAKIDMGLGTVTKWIGKLFDVLTGLPEVQTIKAKFDMGLGTVTKWIGRLFDKLTGNPSPQTIKAKIDMGLGTVTKWIGLLFDVVTGLPEIQTLKLNFEEGTLGGIIGKLLDWIKNGIKIALSFTGGGFGAPVSMQRGPAASSAGALAGGGSTVNVNVNFAGNLIVNDETERRALAREIKELIEEDIRRGLGF